MPWSCAGGQPIGTTCAGMLLLLLLLLGFFVHMYVCACVREVDVSMQLAVQGQCSTMAGRHTLHSWMCGL